MSKFEVIGGLVSGTEESRGKISLDRPNRQWDFPCVLLMSFHHRSRSKSITLGMPGLLTKL